MQNQPVDVTIWRGRPMGYVTGKEFAEACGVKEATVRTWIKRGKIKWYLKIGNETWINCSNEIPTRKKRS